MFTDLGPGTFIAALALVFLMGFATQRGGTCLVAGIGAWMDHGRPDMLLAMLVAALAAGTILWVASLAGTPPPLAASVAPGILTVAGGIVLGLGAMVNGACVFGSVARFGSGQIVYLLTPAGYLAGEVALARFPPLLEASGLRPLEPMAGALMAAGLLVAILLWLAAGPGTNVRPPLLHRMATSPSVATCVIGVAFAPLLLIAGPWTWPELVRELVAEPGKAALAQRVSLLLTLLLGAAWGGWRGHRGRPAGIAAGQALRCLSGGALLALGARLVPGSNDHLLLLGLPFLLPHALVALAAMAAAVSSLMVATNAIRRSGRGWS
ncbi:MAG: YeeE/YedE thiosulfate transporter family protein [Sphingomonadaceae bacterium]